MHPPGNELPDITLLEELGRGEGGVVYHATREGKRCLVKLPCPTSVERADGEVFTRDALALARVSGSALPRILLVEAGEAPYVIMEAATALPLCRLLHGVLKSDELLALALQLVQALERLHLAGFAQLEFALEQILWAPESAQAYIVDHGSLTRVQTAGAAAEQQDRHRETCARDRRQLSRLLRACLLELGKPVAATGLDACCELLADPRVELRKVREAIEGVNGEPRPQSSYPRPPQGEGQGLTLHRNSTRDAILQLRAAFRRGGDTECRIVEVAGPAGIGKTHLLSSFAEEASASGAMVLTMRCRETDWKPFSALKRMLHHHIRSMAELPGERQEEMLDVLRGAAGEMRPWLGLLVPEIGPAPSHRDCDNEVGQLQRMFVEGVAEFLERYLRACPPAVWVVEDMQWLEGSSRDVLSRVAARLRGDRLLLVYSRRDDDHNRATAANIMRMVDPRRIRRIHLQTLNEAEVARIVQAYLGTEQPPRSQLVRQLAELCDGTPVSLINLLERTLEARYLTLVWGQWHLDAAAAQRMQLPESTEGQAISRLQEIEKGDRAVLEALALASPALPLSLLARALRISEDAVRLALRRCRERHILHRDAEGRFQFVHNSLQDAVLSSLNPARREHLHCELAHALRGYDQLDAELTCELARHYACAGAQVSPGLVYETARRAAHHALNSYDDPRTLLFLQHAERAALSAGIALSPEFFQTLAESYWRNGLTADSLSSFDRALSLSKAPFARARILGRMAWVHNYAAHSEKAIVCLRQAFESMGRPLPMRMRVGVPAALLRWSAARAAPRMQRAVERSRQQGDDHHRLETLCTLYFRAYRIFTEHGHLGEAVYCAMEADRLATMLPKGQIPFMAQASVATLMARVGLRERALTRLDRVERDASDMGDPVAATRCAQMRYVISGWLGDVEGARRNARTCAIERSHFMDLGEFALLCFGMYSLETALGQPRAALSWLHRILERVTLHGHTPPIMAVVKEAALSTMGTLGSEANSPLLRRQLDALPTPSLTPGGFLYLLSYPTRMQQLVEQGQLTAEFERLAEQFDTAVREPMRAHPMVMTGYVHILQGRIHGSLSGRPAERMQHQLQLRKLLPKLERAAFGCVAKAHLHAALACRDWFEENARDATAHLAEAERLARTGPCILVMYTAARLRAHMYRAEGLLTSAIEQARIAALLAHRYGYRQRLTFMLEEFGTEVAAGLKFTELREVQEEKDERGIQRHLNALLLISRTASAELSTDRQAQLMLDEVVQSLGADRGLLFLREDTQLVQVAAVPVGSPVSTDGHLSWSVEGVYATGQRMRLNPDSPHPAEPEGSQRPALVAPLVLRGAAIGVVYLERHSDQLPFDEQDGDLLEALANQVPIALELANTLRERERLEEGLRQAQKMEAIGRLAGGIAHDFNNILATIQLAGSALAETLEVYGLGQSEINDILDVTNRGAALTRQLLTFARREVRPPRPVDLNEVVRALMPMLTRLVGKRVHLNAELTALPRILADTTRLEQVVVNLTTNARDAVSRAGRITLRTRVAYVENVERHEGPLPPDLHTGTYVVLSVEDDGAGMSAEIQKRIFDPFFTTKPSHQGTGLGLSTVYGIIKQEAGHIQVASSPASGTRFDLYWPAYDPPREEVESPREGQARAESLRRVP